MRFLWPNRFLPTWRGKDREKYYCKAVLREKNHTVLPVILTATTATTATAVILIEPNLDYKHLLSS
jgi:hypothetical protein